MPVRTIVLRDDTEVTFGDGWARLLKRNVNLNSTSSATYPLELLGDDGKYLDLNRATLQVIPESGAHTTHVVALYGSHDGDNFAELASATATGSSISAAIDIRAIPKLRAAVKTIEGGTSLGAISIFCTNQKQ